MFKIQKGSILIYRVFDIGDEIDLEQVKPKLALFIKNNWAINQGPKQSIIIKNPPLSLRLNDETIKINGNEVDVNIFVKIWDYGVCSVCLNLDASSSSFDDLVNLTSFLDKDTTVDIFARNKVELIFNQIKDVIKKPRIWSVFEDYTLILAESIVKSSVSNTDQPLVEEKVTNPRDLLTSQLAHILIGEKKEELSESMEKDILSTVLQYSKKDMTVIDWNSAFVFEPSGTFDIPDLIEFVLTHQLEIRYYNELLEEKKKILYNNSGKSHLLNVNDLFSNMSVQASQRFLEFSDMIRKVDNSIETVGDFYLAKVIESANHRFNYKIRKVLNDNMEELQQQSESFSNKVQTKQSNFLSLLITILIVIELILPFINRMFK